MKLSRHALHVGLILMSYGVVVILAFLAANYILTHKEAGEMLASIGYPGVFVAAFIAGVNLFPPIPAAALTPLLTSSGLHLFPIVIMLSLGTLAADSVAYFYGARSGEKLSQIKSKKLGRIQAFAHKHHIATPLLVGLYAGLIPLPNELIIVPLALLGIRFRTLILPLLLGDIISQTILALGMQHVFEIWM